MDKLISLSNLTYFKGKMKTDIEGAYGQPNGVAQLDANSKVPTAQIPSAAFNVVQYASVADFPVTGEENKLYIATITNACYRWGGSDYVSISATDVVKYVAQSLTTEQKLQARSNIGAAASADIPTDYVAYSVQELTSAQQEQARANIDAPSTSDVPDDYVAYSEQSLTAAQKTQARTNIGAASSSDIPNNYVAYTAQSLTDGQKTQARTNIGAADASDVQGAVKTTQQSFTPSEQEQARTNIGAASASSVTDITTSVGQANGIASLDAQGHVPSSQLPNVENIVEVNTYQDLPQQGAANKLYIVKDTNDLYRWDGNAYVSVSAADAVKYTVQSLTAAQKTQARTNIGAASSSDVADLGTQITTVADAVAAFSQGDDGFVTELTAVDNGISVSYSDEREPKTITIESGGLDFDSGAVRETNDKYYLYLTKNGEDLPQEKFTPFEIPASGGGGGTTITLTNVVSYRYVRNGKPAEFAFTATCSDASLSLTAEWYINGVLRGTQALQPSGHRFEFDVGEYLNPSSNNSVRVVISANDGMTSTPRNWTVTTTAFEVAWASAVKPIMLYTADSNVTLGVKVSAEADSTNIVSLTVNGETTSRTVTGSASISFTVNKTWFNTGANTITVGMVSSIDPNDRADDITCVAIWAVGATQPIVAFANATETGTQYEQMIINYFVYDPDNEVANCSIQVGSEEPRPIQANRTLQEFPYISYEVQTVTMTLACGQSTATTQVTINRSKYNLGYIVGDELVYNVDPVGHSNADADRDQFGGFVFSQNFDWTNGGFRQDENGNTAFVVKKGNSVTLPRCLFEDADANGKTIDVSYKITNSEQYDSIAMQELNDGANTGIILRANNGELRISNIVGQSFRYCEEGRIDLSVLIEEETDHRLVTVWLDGVPSNVNKYTGGMLVQDENPLVIGSQTCDVWVYAIRVYNVNLSKKQMIQNYISEGNTTKEKVERYEKNTIIDSKDGISIVDLQKAASDLTIVEIQTTRMTTSKSDPVPAHVIITDGTDVLDLPAASGPETGDGTVYKVQGTSSAAYGRSAYNLDIDFKGTNKKYKLDSNAIGVNYINIKVNVASSENANNINAVDWYNTYQPYLTESRSRPGCRDTCQGKPCAVFITNTDSIPVWFSSQLVPAGETVLYAMGDICNSKKNKAVFGQDGKIDEYVTHPTKACIEVSGNDTEPERFRSTAAVFNPDADDGKGRWETDGPWDEEKQQYTKIKHFEWRMNPSGSYSDTSSDMYQVVTAWDNTVAWLVSTINNPTKFKNEIGDYFAINSLLYHFLFIEYFEGYDNVSKNTFYSYDWDATAGKYLWNIKCAYDMDTILAADNDGIPFGDYGIDYGDTIDGTPSGRQYFNAATNTIWVNLKAAYQNELSSMYTSLRSAGAWNSRAIMEKWDNYQSIRPRAAMVIDAYNKYIKPWKTTNVPVGTETGEYDDAYLPRLQGSKTYWRKQFLTYQTSYMDGKYGYYTKTNAINFRTNIADSSTKDFTVKAYAKTYVTILTDDNRSGVRKIGTGDTYTFEGVAVGSNSTMYVTPDRLVQYVHPLNETQNSTFGASGAIKLTDVILGGDEVNTAWDAGSSLDVPSVLLKDLSIRNMVNFSSPLNLTTNVELRTLDTRGTSAGQIILPSYAPLTSIQLNACTGIQAMNLKQVETFTMEPSAMGMNDGGRNLISIRAEGCNAYVMNTVMPRIITQAANSSLAATRRIRVTDINWRFDTVDMLYNIATKWKGYNSVGEAQNTPVITGYVYVDSMSLRKLAAIREVWSSDVLTIEYNPEHVLPTFTVPFIDNENDPILDKQGNAYVQYIDYNDRTYDPVEAGEINPPTKIDPTGQWEYTFTSWSNNLGDPVTEAGTTIVGTFTKAVKKYTVNWYEKENSETPLKTQRVEFGKEAIYDDDPLNPRGIPKLTREEADGYYNVFLGWNKSTGFIREDTNVYAVWDRIHSASVAGLDLHEMSIAQIYCAAKRNQFNDNFLEDYTDITVGRDFNFGNVESQTLLEERYFDGTEFVKFDAYKLFDEDICDYNFTIAIDYEFTEAINGASLVSCCPYGQHQEGFKLYYGTTGASGNHNISVKWGDKDPVIGHGLTRGILVLRHQKGSKFLSIASDNSGVYMARSAGYGNDDTWTDATNHPETYYAGYSDAIYYNDSRRVTDIEVKTACLSFGGVPTPAGRIEVGTAAKGWIHWCKIWKDDLGANNAKELATWPHETWRMQYRGKNIYNTPEGYTDNASFVASAPLAGYYKYFNPPTSGDQYTKGGWEQSMLRAFVNDRCFNALPYCWQSVIEEMSIRTFGGAGERNQLKTTTDKLYIPAYADLGDTSLESEGTRISWYDNNQARIKFMGIAIPEDAQIITNVPEDPTLYGTYTLKDYDVWIPSTSPSDYTVGYVYITSTTAAKKGFIGGRSKGDDTNNIIAGGAQGGLWVKSASYLTRTISQESGQNSSFSYVVDNRGSIQTMWAYDTYQVRGVVLMFSL